MCFKALVFLLGCCFLSPPSQATALHDAAKKGDIAAIAAALDSGADVNEIAGLVSPLYIATINSRLEAVKLLIKRGADVSLSTKFGSPLHAAAQTGCLDCVKLLVEAGADVNALTPERKPPIHLAKKFGHLEVADYLIMQGYVHPTPPPISPMLKSADPMVSDNGGHVVGKDARQWRHVACDVADILGQRPNGGLVRNMAVKVTHQPTLSEIASVGQPSG